MAESPEEMLRNLPPDWWQRALAIEELLKWFKEFIVGLLVGGSVNGKFQYFLYTGFLLHYKGNLLWLTAGHVVDNLSQILSSPNFSLSIMRWIDGYDVPGAEAIPVNHSNMLMKSWISEGLDFGAIVIPLLESQNLLANEKISVMEERIWRNLKYASPEGYYVVGFPRVWNDFKETPVKGNQVLRSIKANLACLPAQPISPPIDSSSETFWKHSGAFYGKIIQYPDRPNLKVEDIAGMSGGPVLSIERSEDSKIGIRLAGIQVEWKPDSGIVRAEPIDAVAKALDKWL